MDLDQENAISRSQSPGLSNDAFYGHFTSKDHLVAAILEDGTERLGQYLAHLMVSGRLGALLEAPLAELGSPSPADDALLIAHAVVGTLADHLWTRTGPTPATITRVVEFCLRSIT